MFNAHLVCVAGRHNETSERSLAAQHKAENLLTIQHRKLLE